MILEHLKYIQVRNQNSVVFATINCPNVSNEINAELIQDFRLVLDYCRAQAQVLVIQGNAEYFCNGAELSSLDRYASVDGKLQSQLYDVWLDMVKANFIVISLVKGKVNAGGVGFIAASDIVLASPQASFCLSELLFGLYPACVLPFLVQRIGRQKAHFLTLTTKAVDGHTAHSLGIADICTEFPDKELRLLLIRLSRLSKQAVGNYKRYLSSITDDIASYKAYAVEENMQMFSDPENQLRIRSFMEAGILSTPYKS